MPETNIIMRLLKAFVMVLGSGLKYMTKSTSNFFTGLVSFIMFYSFYNYIVIVIVFLFTLTKHVLRRVCGFDELQKYLDDLIPVDDLKRSWKEANKDPGRPWIQELYEETLPYIEMVKTINYVDGGIICTIIVCSLIVLKYILNLSLARRLIYKARGVYVYEGLVAGSTFLQSTGPDCQVKVYRANTFTFTFLGYGTRISETILAIPTHVFKTGNGKFMLQGIRPGAGKISYEGNAIPSQIQADMSYIPLTRQMFSVMGTAIAKVSKNEISGQMVSIAGPLGVSTGILNKHRSSFGLVTYSGSTEKGYSGAPYFIKNIIYGVHGGMAGETNIGTSAYLIKAEVSKLFRNEGSLAYSSPSNDDDRGEDLVAETRTRNKQPKYWDNDMMAKYVEERITHAADYEDTWAGGADMDYDAELEFPEGADIPVEILVDKLQGKSAADLDIMLAMISKMKSRMIVEPHGNEDNTEPIVVEDVMSTLTLDLAKRMKVMEDLTSHLKEQNALIRKELEEVKKELEQSREQVVEARRECSLVKAQTEQAYLESRKLGPQVNPYPCNSCGRSFKTDLGLEAHKTSKHLNEQKNGPEKPEGALSHDEADTLKKTGNTAFLERASRKPIRRIYKGRSPLSAPQPLFQSLMKRLDVIASLMEKQQENLRKPQEEPAGPSSDISQN
uniref:C2H2-type domain-containing protein n=1 Tax=Mortimer virus TaxID=2600330 RepID=A0A5B8X9T2_9VIRU|nr:hypothetical protein 2 [Mortimer virus]